MALRPLIAVLLWSVAVISPAAAAGASPDKLSGLVGNSPFGQARANASATNTSGELIEFRGVSEEGGKRYFSIHETATRRSIWVELNDPVNGVLVKAFDAEHDSVTVDYQGRPLTLSLKRAPAVPQSMQMAPVPPNTVGGIQPPNQAMQASLAPGDQQRLQQIQEEIRRRRAARMQPSGQPNAAFPRPGTPPAPSNAPGPQPVPPR